MTPPLGYTTFGRSGLRVSEVALGTMTFGDEWGWGADAAESARIFDVFADAGGTFVDTASNYTEGTSERLVGELAAGRRDRFVIATKYTLTIDPSDPNAGGNHRKSLVRSLDQSLRRLRSDYVDLLWLHMRDEATPIEEAVRALDDQVRLGKVLYVGISDSPAWVAAQANTLAELRGWTPFVGLQLPYSLLDRDAERDLFPMAAAFGLTVTAWGTLEQGILSGRPPEERLRETGQPSERAERAVEALREIAEAHDCSPAQVAIAWVRSRPGSPEVIPILGARTESQIDDNLGALAVALSDADLERLDGVAPPRLGFPRDFLESTHVRGLIYGNTYERLALASR
jgi:aryl-alcohol dehydrogenase-like predicted oxidoreductase